MTDREQTQAESARSARARARSVREGYPDPPAWATKWGETPTWRRAALKLAQDVLRLTRELERTKGEAVTRHRERIYASNPVAMRGRK